MSDSSQSGALDVKKLERRLRRQVANAVHDFRMIEAGDRIMACLSGGKDSYTMLDMLLRLQRNAPVHFELVAVNLDQKQPGFPSHVLPEYLRSRGVSFHVLEQDTYGVVKRVVKAGKSYCGLCSRLRRGALYRYARENGIGKIALGHHRDDMIETLFLNMFHGGRLAAMPPKLLSDDGRCVVIRPLAYCVERDIARYARARGFPLIPCRLCGTQGSSERAAVKSMLAAWERDTPGRQASIFAAMQSVKPSQLADGQLHDFGSLRAREEAESQVAAAGVGR